MIPSIKRLTIRKENSKYMKQDYCETVDDMNTGPYKYKC